MAVYAMGPPVEAKVITLSAVSARTTIPAGTSLRLVSDVDCWVQFGGGAVAAVVATPPAIYLPAKYELLIQRPVQNAATAGVAPTNVAAIAAGAGSLSITGVG